jgi:tetratricopeptide (TPR) repeat protein
MSSDELFQEAYRLSVLEEKHKEAIALCKKALALDPNNNKALVYLGMLLSDYGSDEEKAEARDHFITAINNVTDEKQLCDSGFEESALHHLAIWEWEHDHLTVAALLFLTDIATCQSKESYDYLMTVCAELAPEDLPDLKIVFSKVFQFSNEHSRPHVSGPVRNALSEP